MSLLSKIDPFFFTKERTFLLYNVHFTLYKPFTIKIQKEKKTESPSMIISFYFATTAIVEFSHYLALSLADHTINFLRMKITPIGDDLKIGRIHGKLTKATFFKIYFDEIGSYAKNYGIYSAQHFQKAIDFFPLQLQNLSWMNLLEKDAFLKIALPIQELFLKCKKNFIHCTIYSLKNVNLIIHSPTLNDQIKKLNRSIELIQETIDMLVFYKSS